MKCIECGAELLAERAELGYQYCTKKQCQDVHYRGLVVTTIAVNKSADSVVVADSEELAKRGEAGEFAKKDTSLGSTYWQVPGVRTSGSRKAVGRGRVPAMRQPTQRAWTAEQERLVRLYNGMGLSPRQIVERARENAPRLKITESLVTKIMCAPPGPPAAKGGWH